MVKGIYQLLVIGMLGLGTLHAKEDAPRGYEPISQLEKAKAEAIQKKSLLVLVVKGADDQCPNCAAAMENGERAMGSGVVKVFARAEALNAGESTGFTPAMKTRAAKKFTYGAWVTFLVFNPDGSELLVEADRKGLQSNKDAIADFKKAVAEHKRALK